jgi:hypothetical protein
MPNKTYALDEFPLWMQEDWQKWYDVARSYQRAVKILLDAEVPERDFYSERDVLPILSMVRHYAELVMKCLLIKNGELAIGSHDLEALKNRLDKFHPDVFSVGAWEFLRFLNGIDPSGGAFRYPVDRSNKQFFTDASEHHTIDLAYLYPVCQQMFEHVTEFVGKT